MAKSAVSSQQSAVTSSLQPPASSLHMGLLVLCFGFLLLLVFGPVQLITAQEPPQQIPYSAHFANPIPVEVEPFRIVTPVSTGFHFLQPPASSLQPPSRPESQYLPEHLRGLPMTYPLPAPPASESGVHWVGYNRSPYNTTLGIRLDTSYKLVRETNIVNFLSKDQFVIAAGGTILPYQSPCSIFGVRGLFGYADNQTAAHDEESVSIDAFVGTRYKSFYVKLGGFADNHQNMQKAGATVGFLTVFPLIDYLTFDAAFGFDTTGIFLAREDRWRIEPAEVDYQFRVGTFWTPNLQVGASFVLLETPSSGNKSGIGGFCNFYHDRWIIGLDISSMETDVRGFVNIGLSWGPHPGDHPRDLAFDGIDNVGWLSRPVDRDISIGTNEFYVGP